MDDNSSGTQYYETKAVRKWIESSPLREQWWRRKCPMCGAGSLVFKLRGPTDNYVVKVSCVECDWEVE